MMLLGATLVISGVVIVYRTANGMIKARMVEPGGQLYLGSNALNFVIGIVFAAAGVLFVVNNLRGNPLESVSDTHSLNLKSESHSNLIA